MEKLSLLKGNNIELLKQLEDNSVDSVVTDPPYGLSFMNKKWDYDVPSIEFWKEVYRVLKPGGHILSFGGTRTYHRMVVNMEDAGFEIRDQIMWLYGSGFPKSHNIGKAYDKKMGGVEDNPYQHMGTALKPANEPICLARKPFKGTVVDNVIQWGTGGINIDECRISHNEPIKVIKAQEGGNKVYGQAGRREDTTELKEEGRFPANIILDEEAGKILDEQSGIVSQGHWPKGETKGFGEFGGGETTYEGVGPKDKTKSGASRFFYTAKVSKKERNMGCDMLEETTSDKIGSTYAGNQTSSKIGGNPDKATQPKKNNHPTVKPVSLMTYLCRLITPKGGVVLDPFMGSGSTGISALLEGFRFIGMEMDEDYFNIAETRINNYEEYRQFIKK